MIAIGLSIFLLFILALGWLLLLFWPESERRCSLSLSFILGGGLVTWQLFILTFIFRLNLGNWFLVLFFVELLWLIYYHYSQEKLSLPKLKLEKPLGNLELLLLALIAAAAALALVRVATHPLLTFDALSDWAYRVKALYYHQSDLFNLSSTSYWRALAKPNYPWHLPLLAWFQAKIIGGVRDTWINFLPWCYYLSLLLTVYATAKEKLSRIWSLALTLLVSTMPLIFYHSYNFYADLPLAASLAVICLVWRRYLASRSLVSLSLLAVLAGFALAIKSEAVFCIAILFLLSGFKLIKDQMSLRSLWPVLVTLVLATPWLSWMIYYQLRLSNVPAGLSWHPEVFDNIWRSLFFAQNWHLWWYFILAMLIASRSSMKTNQIFLYSALYFVLTLLTIMCLYLFTESYRYALDNSALSRNFILLIPISLPLLVDSLAAWFNPKNN